VRQWLVEAAEQLRAFARHVLHDVRVQQVQLDELFALLSAVKDGDVSAAVAIERLNRSPSWVWTAMDPESKLLLVIDVGARTLAMAQRLVHQEDTGPQLVLLDIALPDMNGLDVLTAMRTQNPTITVVMITAYGTVERAVQAMKQGAYDFVLKPFAPDHLRRIV
jgi:CheY-like chemotaxis protein